MKMSITGLALALSIAIEAQAAIPADSGRGARAFESLGCGQCHNSSGNDLSRLLDRNFTPSALAATMWNHAPEMWAAMGARGVRTGDLDAQTAADLFAYFYSTRFFERPADAGRGKRLFTEKHCAECHGSTEWTSLGHPIAMVSAMWNHAATMRQEFARRGWRWPDLTAQDLGDIMVYLRGLPSARNSPISLEVNSGSNGEALFQSKGCAGCHTAKLALTARLKGDTLTDIGVAMWNHSSKMAANPPRLEVDDMRDLLSYLWAEQFFQDSGDLSAGRRVFKDKRCVVCHNDPASGAPPLPKPAQAFSAASMVAALWHHGPQMQAQMKTKSIPWPRFGSKEMADLIAYLNSAPNDSNHGDKP